MLFVFLDMTLGDQNCIKTRKMSKVLGKNTQTCYIIIKIPRVWERINVHEKECVPCSVPLAVVIISRDVLLVLAGIVIRYISLQKPVSLLNNFIFTGQPWL